MSGQPELTTQETQQGRQGRDGGGRSVLTLLSCEVTGARGQAGYRISSSSLTLDLFILLVGVKLAVCLFYKRDIAGVTGRDRYDNCASFLVFWC